MCALYHQLFINFPYFFLNKKTYLIIQLYFFIEFNVKKLFVLFILCLNIFLNKYIYINLWLLLRIYSVNGFIFEYLQ